MRPRKLDLYAGEGVGGSGYASAGFAIYAVDNDPKRLAHNPYPSHLGDVIEVMGTLIAGGAVDFHHKDGTVEWLTLRDFDAIHASPTCTGYSRGTVALPDRLDRYDRLIGVTRALLIEAGLPYVIENVEDAKPELDHPILLCARMFGLGAIDTDGTPLVLDRHRLFESNIFLLAPEHEPHSRREPLPGTPVCACGETHFQVAGLYGGGRRDKYQARHIRHGGYVPPDLDVVRALAGAPWATERGCFHSIPPSFTAFIGAQLLDHLRTEAVA